MLVCTGLLLVSHACDEQNIAGKDALAGIIIVSFVLIMYVRMLATIFACVRCSFYSRDVELWVCHVSWLY